MCCASGRRHSKKVLSMEKSAAYSREPTDLPEKEAHFKAQEQRVSDTLFHLLLPHPALISEFHLSLYCPFAAGELPWTSIT